MNKKYNLKLDLQFRCNNSTMKFDEFDNNTSDFFIRVTRAGELIDISKAIVTLVVIKPDNSVDAQFVDIDSNRAYCHLKPTMKNLVGKYEAIASITVDGETVNTGIDNPIIYEVTENKFLRQLNQKVVTEERFTLLTDMINRLSTIEISEEQRVINEAERILSEENRKIEEAKRVEVELIRQHEEADRTKYDAIRESNENIRKINEETRISSENVRLENEANRIEQEANRVKAEQLRKDNYNLMTEDEERRRSEANAHKEAEVLRVQAETNRVNEEAKRRISEQARVSAENTRVSNENTRKASEVTRQTNETQRVEAETQRQSRYNSFIADAEANANNFENYTNTVKVKEEERKSNELDRKSQETKRVSNEVERISNENTRKANEVTRIESEKQRVDAENLRKEKIIEIQSDYDSLKKVIIDENVSANLQNQINQTNSQLEQNTSKINGSYNDLYNIGTTSVLFSPRVDFNSEYFRIPFIVVTKHGTIVAGSDIRYNSSADESFISIGTARSVDGGKTWIDKTVAMANSGQSAEYSRCMDGTILYDEVNDRLWLLGNYWHTGTINWTRSNTHKDPDWDIKVCYSDDDGRTWKGHKSLRDLCPEGYSQFIGGVGSGIRMNNGNLVFPIQISPLGERPNVYTESGLIYSTNGGSDWNICSSFVPGFASECNIVELNNQLIINCRQEQSNLRKIYTTTNMGASWEYNKLSETTRQNSVCQGSMIKIPYDGESILFSSPDGESRNALNLKVMTNSMNMFSGVTTIVAGSTNGYSCLAYDKFNNKLYVVYEDWGTIRVHDLSYSLKDIKKSKSDSSNYDKSSYHNVLNLYISSTGDDNNAGISASSPVRTFTKIQELTKKYNYARVDIYVDVNYNDSFKIANISGDVRILSYPSGVLNIKGGYIRSINQIQFNCDVNILEGFSSAYGIAIEGSNVVFKNLTCNIDLEMSPIYNLKSSVSFSGKLTSNKTYQALVTAKNNTQTYLGVHLANSMPFIMGDNSNHSITVNESESGLPLETGNSGLYNRRGELYGSMAMVINYNRNIIPIFDGTKITNRNNVTKCFIANSFVHYTIALSVNSGSNLINADKLFTMKPINTPLVEKQIPLTLYGSGGSLLGTIQAKIKTNGEVILIGNAPAGVTEIYAAGNYFIV